MPLIVLSAQRIHKGKDGEQAVFKPHGSSGREHSYLLDYNLPDIRVPALITFISSIEPNWILQTKK